MLFVKKNWILTSLLALFFCSSAHASTTPIEVNVSNATQVGSGFGNSFTQTFSVNGEVKTLTLTAWADTVSNNNTSTDTIIESAEIGSYGGGLGISNDTSGDSHTADNYQSNINERDYDFFLLDFDGVDVTLSAITSGYTSVGTDVSIAAVTKSDLSGETWESVDNNHSLSSGYGQFQSISNSSGYYIDSFTSESGDDVSGTSSSMWIVGALNHHFGGNASSEGNDYFKLASISFTTGGGGGNSTDIPEPAPIALMLIALIAFIRQNKLQK